MRSEALMTRSQPESILAAALRDVSRWLTLERALQLTIVATIVTSVLAAGAILAWLEAARKLRWVALLALVAVSLVYAWRNRGGQKPIALYASAAAFVALALLSAAWSAFPALTAARGTALALLFIACGALANATAGRPDAIRAVLDAILIGTVVVAAGGLVVLALAYDRAVAPATTVMPARYQGLGGGPNTAMMVLSIGVPLAARALFDARTRVGRLAACSALLLLLGSVVASGSRGALAASFGGLFVYAVLARREMLFRLAAAAAVLVLFGVAVAIMRIPQPLPPGSTNPPTAYVAPDPNPAPVKPRPGYADANLLLRLQDDVGLPPTDTRPRLRTLFGTSGRTEAWSGALGQAAERPLLGYGFGTEDRVFVERYIGFNSGVPESSYVGLLLQLGAIGAAAFAAFVALLLVRTLRSLRVLAGPELGLAAACAGGLVAGLVLAGSQSYIYAVGNNATAAVWLCAFLLAATTSPPVSGIRS
jgi:O-antigen ligase/polysaccharide polymerase Wzy-like membrane protein